MVRASGPLCWLSNVIRKLILDRFVFGLPVVRSDASPFCI